MSKWAKFLELLKPKGRKRRAKAQASSVGSRTLRHGGGQGRSARKKQQQPQRGAGEKWLFDSARKAPGKDLLDVLAAQRADEILGAEASAEDGLFEGNGSGIRKKRRQAKQFGTRRAERQQKKEGFGATEARSKWREEHIAIFSK